MCATPLTAPPTAYDGAAVLQREVSDRMGERLDYIRHALQRILDAGSGTGYGAVGLRSRYPDAQVIELDLAPSMLRVSSRDKQASAPRRPAGALVPPRRAAAAVRRHRAPAAGRRQRGHDLVQSGHPVGEHPGRGVCRVSPRAAGGRPVDVFHPGAGHAQRAEPRLCRRGPPPHVNRFIDMHDIGDALVRAGFTTR